MNATLIAFALLAPTAPQPSPSPDVKDTVRNGLKWLSGQQEPDGTWKSVNNLGHTTVTATAGLALLMEGSTPASGTYAAQLRKCIDWFEKNADASGRLGSKTGNEQYQYINSHSQALLFLSCSYDVDDNAERRKRLRPVLEKAVGFLANAQSVRGGWGYADARTVNNYDDSQTTGAVLNALLAARKAGIPVPKALIDKGFGYLVRATNKQGGIIFSLFNNQIPRGNDGQAGISAQAAAASLLLEGPRPALFAAWVGNASTTVTQAQYLTILKQGNGVYVLTQYQNVARVAFALGETGHGKLDPKAEQELRWSEQRATLFQALKGLQQKDGSWNDQSFGPAHFTAQALVVLQLENDYLPAFSR